MIHVLRFPVWLLLLLVGCLLASMYVVVALPLLLWSIYSNSRFPDPGAPLAVMLETFERLWPRRSNP